MIIKVVAAGANDFAKLYRYDKGEYIVGVDAGLQVLHDMGIEADLAIGDFDSLEKEKIKAREVHTFPSKKDKSDLALALDFLTKKDFERIEIYNATGLRLDHFFSAIFDLAHFEDERIVIIDANNGIFVAPKSLELHKKDVLDYYISFFSIYPETILTLEGFKYPLDNYPLQVLDNLTLSNELVEEVGKVTINKPILVMVTNDNTKQKQ